MTYGVRSRKKDSKSRRNEGL